MRAIQYKIISELKIIVEYYSGVIRLVDIIEQRNILIEDPGFNPQFNMIFDFRDAHFDIMPQEIHDYVDYLKSKPKFLNRRFAAALAIKPNETAIFLIFISRTVTLPQHAQVFSTIDAAFNFVSVSHDDEKVVEEAFEELKRKAKPIQ